MNINVSLESYIVLLFFVKKPCISLGLFMFILDAWKKTSSHLLSMSLNWVLRGLPIMFLHCTVILWLQSWGLDPDRSYTIKTLYYISIVTWYHKCTHILFQSTWKLKYHKFHNIFEICWQGFIWIMMWYLVKLLLEWLNSLFFWYLLDHSLTWA